MVETAIIPVANRLRVLIADDHRAVLREMVRFLDDYFEVVGTAADGQELVEAAISLRPDVIVSDVRMPHLTGPEAMRELMNRGHEIPFVLVSMEASCASLWIEQGAAAYVHKDHLSRDIVPAIQSAVREDTQLSRRTGSLAVSSTSI